MENSLCEIRMEPDFFVISRNFRDRMFTGARGKGKTGFDRESARGLLPESGVGSTWSNRKERAEVAVGITWLP